MTPQTLPPGPRLPALLQTLGNWSRPIPFIEGARRRYGKRFTVRYLAQPPIVMISDPDEIKEVFTAPPHVLHPGEGARLLEPVVGPHSVILLDEAPHLEQRKLMLPAFHGERMQALTGLMEELTVREIESWPREEPIELHPRVQRLTLEIIMRAVFGLERGAQLDQLRELLTRVLAYSENPLSLLPPLPGPLARFGPMAGLERLRARVDEMIFALIDERRRDGTEGVDVLAMLLAARHEDDTPMTNQELRDELITALVAGHETTASQLAWAFERIAREDRVRERLHADIDAGGEDYVIATITEVMRLRPVIPNAEPRLVKEAVTIGGVEYPPGVMLFANAYLVHTDPDVYPDPYVFRPERFLDASPGTYTWIPFGGGRRRCLGASFAQLEMKIVLRELLARCELRPAEPARETARRRSITISPARGATVVLGDRTRAGGARAATPFARARRRPALPAGAPG